MAYLASTPSSPVAIADAIAALHADGYVVLKAAKEPWRVRALHGDLRERFEQTPFCAGDFYGGRTKRFGGLLKRSQHAEAFVMDDAVLAIAEAVLSSHCDCVQLNLTQAIAVHPGQTRQAPHRDQDMWQGVKGAQVYLINVMWPFSPYTKENGATLIYPGSHRDPEGAQRDEAEALAVEMAPGDALIFLGSTLHGAGANVSRNVRQGMIVSYCLGWLKPYENQWLVYPPEIARGFSPELAALVGYRQHRPNLGNVEGRCPSLLLNESVPDSVGAVDTLRPEQAERLAHFVAGERARAEWGGVHV
jgi:hypothetical protein